MAVSIDEHVVDGGKYRCRDGQDCLLRATPRAEKNGLSASLGRTLCEMRQSHLEFLFVRLYSGLTLTSGHCADIADIMWEILGYLAIGIACITCAIVIGAAFD